MSHDQKPHHTFLYLWIIGALLVLVVSMVSYILDAPQKTAPLEEVVPITSATTTPVSTDTTGVFTLALGETGESHGWSITPLAVIEDSRCPSDVQCIQAGIVRVSVRIGTTSPHTLTLAVPEQVEGGTITLVQVAPERIATTPIMPKDYLFSFLVVTQ